MVDQRNSGNAESTVFNALERMQRNLGDTQVRVHRLMQVLKDYFFCNEEFQAGLLEDVIMWTLAAVALNDRRDHCEHLFDSMVDMAYTETEEATQTLTENERENAYITAAARHDKLAKPITEILQDSLAALQFRDKDDPTVMIARTLLSMRDPYSVHASPLQLRDLIAHCAMLSITMNNYALGIEGAANDALIAMRDVLEAAAAIKSSVHAAVTAGRLVVRDGQLIDPLDEVEE